MNKTIGWITTPIILIFGIVFFIHSLGIPAGASDAIGPRLVPLLMSGLAIALCVPLLYQDYCVHKGAPTQNHDITVESLLLTAAPLILLVALYGNAMAWFGYLISTVLCGFIAFRLFGNTWRTSAIHSVIGGVLFYVIFIRFMRIFDPRGSILDISDYLR